jgi:hypothetical protein
VCEEAAPDGIVACGGRETAGGDEALQQCGAAALEGPRVAEDVPHFVPREPRAPRHRLLPLLLLGVAEKRLLVQLRPPARPRVHAQPRNNNNIYIHTHT